LTTKEPRIEPSPGFSRNVYWQPRKHKTRHELFTESVNKIALSANDNKRIIQPDKIQTLDHGNRTGWHGEPTGEAWQRGRGAWGKLRGAKGELIGCKGKWSKMNKTSLLRIVGLRESALWDCVVPRPPKEDLYKKTNDRKCSFRRPWLYPRPGFAWVHANCVQLPPSEKRREVVPTRT